VSPASISNQNSGFRNKPQLRIDFQKPLRVLCATNQRRGSASTTGGFSVPFNPSSLLPPQYEACCVIADLRHGADNTSRA
jgi:hypothetical protein